jgi:Fur family ferric uptake transcriptional regulator
LLNAIIRMTQRISKPGSSAGSHDAFVARLRQLGLRVTPQRVLVLEALDSASGHLSADEIMRWVAERSPAINLATIYRTLDTLTAAGLVTQTDLGGGSAAYELAGAVQHHHLVCERCGTVTKLDDDLFAPLRERLLREQRFLVSTTHLALFGLCHACWEAPRGTATSS